VMGRNRKEKVRKVRKAAETDSEAGEKMKK
jgi:hypothetical protein